jgi:hypothetical protein
MSATVGVLAEPLAVSADRGRYRRAVVWKANPRSLQYMRERFAEAAPDGTLVDAGPRLADAVRGAERVVLLYPDAIGLGWERIERTVLAAKAAGTRIEVLNGRRRRFAFDARTRRALRVRRVLERTMLAELLVAPVIIGMAPLLWLADALRARR